MLLNGYISLQSAFQADIRPLLSQELAAKDSALSAALMRVEGVRLLVEAAFKANSQGYLSTGKVLALLRMEVDSAKWREAKLILQAALKPERGKQYLVCEVRESTQTDWRPIRLDIADCWPTEESEVRHV